MTNISSSLDDANHGPRSPLLLVVLFILALCLFAGFIELGNWQVRRLVWKRDLIERVNQRVHAMVVAPPSADQWNNVNAERDEYRHVRLTGIFQHDQQTLIWAASDYGSGYWVITPLRLIDGSIVLVNRGFAPADWCGRDSQCAREPTGETTITGLVRMTEPSTFFRRNDPEHNSWYTRDISAIAKARGLSHVAPYFIDEDGKSGESTWPKGGLTVISFPNNHLTYLITWYLLALLVLTASVYVGYSEYKLRRQLRA